LSNALGRAVVFKWCNSQVGVGQEKRAQSIKVNAERTVLFSKIILSDQHVIYDYTYIYTHTHVTDSGLDGLGSNPSGDEIFHLTRPALGPTQSPVKWVPVLSRQQSAARACC